MKKIHVLIIVIVASFIALAVQILFGNFLSAKLATFPGLRNLNLFNPRAPIVVTNKETVRVSDANDAVETANSVKSKLAVVVYYDGTGSNAKIIASGGALNWTADGYFVTTKAALAVANKTYAVVVNNGDIFPIKAVYADTASSLVILSTDARNQSTIESVAGNDLRPGQKMLMILNSLAPNKNTFLESYVRAYPTDVSGVVFSSDAVQRSIAIQNVGTLAPGHAAINLNGRLAGMWDGTNVISSDAIQVFADNFFSSNFQIIRPNFGFTYKQLTASEARGLQLEVGAQVISVAAGSPAAASGLKTGDIITVMNGQDIDDEVLMESLLAATTPGEAATLTVMRDGQLTSIVITPKILE
jgi:S1-C subfamily serine protease